MRAASALLALLIGACAPKAEGPAQVLALDCAKPFAAQVAEIIAQPLNPAPKDPAEPYRFYSTHDGKASYLITEPGAPGHPAIMMQQAVGPEVKTTGCAYGEKAGYDQLLAYMEGLKAWRRQ